MKPGDLKVGDVIDLGGGRSGEVIWPPRYTSKTKTYYIEIRTPEWVSSIKVPEADDLSVKRTLTRRSKKDDDD